MNGLQSIIETLFEQSSSSFSLKDKQAIIDTMALLDTGEIRAASKIEGLWKTNVWIKKAILLAFGLYKNKKIEAGCTTFYDKIPLKFSEWSQNKLEQSGIRIVPQAIARYGSFINKKVILMPSYINIGAYIDEGCMIDTWATIGSCAQIGKNVHISGGVGIGGVLEPLQMTPTIIEDNCFIGARSEIVEGVIIEKGSVISMGVFIGQSTKIYNRLTDTITYGRIPAGSVVISGSLPSSNNKYNLNCAIIVKHVDEQTRSKTAINDLLRNI
jgi:2,3,4,5-tetrahydropyridine-2-carboxylate N-succinyltransferase